jgi:hypothetical protein
MLIVVAEHYDRDVGNAIARLMSMLGPLLLVVMGIATAFIVIAMLTAVFSVNEMAFDRAACQLAVEEETENMMIERRQNRQRGFTLGVAGGHVDFGPVGVPGAAQFLSPRREGPRGDRTLPDRRVGNRARRLRPGRGRYPSDGEGLQALIEAPGDAKNWDGPYLKKAVPRDPWGNDYSYSAGGQAGYELGSLGADGKSGGEGDSADISSSD